MFIQTDMRLVNSANIDHPFLDVFSLKSILLALTLRCCFFENTCKFYQDIETREKEKMRV